MKKTIAQIFRDELKRAKLISLPNKVNGLSSKVDGISGKVDNLAKRMDEMADAAKIIRENEQNLKDLGNLKNRLDLLDKIYVKVDKIAGEVTTYRGQQELNSGKLTDHDNRIEKVEKHLHLTATVA